ncbi:dienelactone hydrolase family protein [Yinghuangia seranimata]|uniref:dienelactone hydrolase family protein n=1 Tax=Yinghuangia seranimata TaxID=408067 RepID=UPI00248C3065|nr:dienelactone hydrolase family protein [Yinghuangia seranimata]MDI2128884.1 dienelactone hydrolase family protein [Yinghuangia seranimata]
MVEDVDLAAPAYAGTPGLRGLLARPAGPGPWPGVVVLFEGTGADDVNRGHVERMAAAGYLALMPDIYHGRSAARCMVSTLRGIPAGKGPAYQDIEAARQWLLASPDCTGRIGVLGFCMGGSFALVLATQGGYQVASANYGELPDDVDEAMKDACPVVASYGGKDRVFRSRAGRLEAALAKAGVEHDVRLYPGAGHSFLNDVANSPLVLRPLLKAIMGIGPDPAAAADAWGRIDAFFARHLVGDGVDAADVGDVADVANVADIADVADVADGPGSGTTPL